MYPSGDPVPLTSHPNFAARIGRWSAHNRKKAVLGWLAFVVIALLAGNLAGMRMLTGGDSMTGEAATAQKILTEAGRGSTAEESVLVQSSAHTVGDPQFRSAIGATADAVRAQRWVSRVRSPNQPGNEMLVARDRHSALVQFEVEGDAMQNTERVRPVLAQVARVQRAQPQFRIEQFGAASFAEAAQRSGDKDFHRAELLSIPVTIVILLLAFGALMAAVLPVILALTAVAAAAGLALLTSNVFPISSSTFSVMLLIGLAVGVDYSLFYIRREREERAAGRTAEAALEAAAATSGRSVLISGLTVMVAVGGMFFAGSGDFRGIAAGTILVVATSVIGSLTVLPAVLAKLGDRIEKGRLPFRTRRSRVAGQDRFWSAVLRPVLRHPLVAAVAATTVLLTLAVPALQMHTAVPGTDDYPKTMEILKTSVRIQAAFPGGPMPAQVVVNADDVHSTQFASAVRDFRQQALATGMVSEPISVQLAGNHVAIVSAPLAGKGHDSTSVRALNALRDQVVPRTLANAPGVQAVAVGGDTAMAKDYNDTLRSHAPIVLLFVLGLAFVLLLVTFRSVVIPLKAIVLNLLSVGAAYGVLVAVFQWGWGEHLLGFESNGAIAAWIPMFLFVVLFGLSMDYHVFVLSRIREAVDRGMNTDDAVEHGIRSTAGVVTSAAFVMVVVFAIFGSLTQLSMKEIGVGLAVAVALDATLIRTVLLPASMKLLGERNWWLPRRLTWLPQIAIEAPVATESTS
jgi:uncharacterized membrane protein YdfJ with MMPL/SSD domain